EQATEVIDSLSELIIKVESDPADSESLRSIRRAVHTLKGDSTAFGFGELTTLAHQYEDALDRVRDGAGIASRALIDLLLAGADALAAMIAHYRDDAPIPETEELVAGLAALHTEAADEKKEAKPAKSAAKKSSKKSNAELVVADDVIDEPQPDEAQTVEERRADADRRSGKERRGAQSMTMRVESDRIDAAMNIVGELIIQRSMISTLAAEVEADRHGDDNARRLSEAVALSSRLLS